MYPELFTLPILGLSIKTYGFCLMVGFLSAVWLAVQRAQRLKANPDTVLDLSFLALVFGVAGARLFYVVHYWKSEFAPAPNPLLAVINITQGGLEFLGGLLGALAAILVYALRSKKPISTRLYLDIMAPSVMWGLAFGRLGCFFNGCCFGGTCIDPATQQAAIPWAVQFPFGSPAHWRQWQEREVTVPAELITSSPDLLQPSLLDAPLLAMSVEKRELATRRYEDLQKEYQHAKAEAPEAESLSRVKAALDAASKAKTVRDRELAPLRLAQLYPSRAAPTRNTSVTELEKLAGQARSLPVHPTQLYAAINALLLCGVLSAVLYVRKRHGVVLGALFVLYPIPRVLLEMIRADNPPDVLGLTISQAVSLGMFAAGVLYLLILYKRMPERSPVLA